MAALQKVKLMATQCASLRSPTRSPSPSTSPVIRLRSRRRRKTLKMLLSRRIPPSPDRYSSDSMSTQERRSLKSEEMEVRVRRKLKDLFVSSPEEERREGGREDEDEEEGLLRDARFNGRIAWRRPFTASFRNRLLFRRRRNWRPVLFTIPEIE